MEKIIKTIAEELNIKTTQVENTIKLIDEGNTIPFIARYRKEVTGGLSDEILRTFGERLTYLRNLETRKEEVIKSIDEQGKLTDEIIQAVAIAKTLAEVEDIYRPYKQKKKTRATVAKAKGLEPLSQIIIEQKEKTSIIELAKQYVNIERLSEEDKKNKDKVVATPEDAIQGALDIIAEDISDNAKYRKEIKNQQSGQAKKERMKLAIGASAVILAGGGIIGFAVYQNHQNLYGTYCKVGEHELSRIEYEFFYNSTVNNFLTSYGSYLSAFGLDTSKPFSEQQYSEEMTWEQYFQSQTLELLKEVLILSDAANESGYKLDEKTYTEFYDNAEETSKEYELTLDEYIKQMYGTNATKKNIEKTLRTYFLASDYAEYLQNNELVPSKEEIEDYYNKNKDDYDKGCIKTWDEISIDTLV